MASIERFSVALFFPDGSYVYEAQNLSAISAVALARRCSQRPAAITGMIQRIIITDAEDFTVFEWRHGEGVTYPRYDATAGRFVADETEETGQR